MTSSAGAFGREASAPWWRRALRLVALLVVNLGALPLTAWVYVRCADRIVSDASTWHATLRYASYATCEGGICRDVPGDHHSCDGNGRRFDYRLNRQGFRSPELPERRAAPDAVRVAFFGDSMMFGLGVDDGEALPEAFAAAMRRRAPGVRVEALNFALPMNYLASSLRAWEGFARRYDPDVLVMGVSSKTLTLQYQDVNYWITQIRASPLRRALVRRPWGRWIIRDLQFRQRGALDDGDVERLLRAPMLRLRDAQRRQGFAVVMWEWFEEDDDATPQLAPPGLRVLRVTSGMTLSQYRDSPYAIPRDGHPTAAGHAHFAEILAERLEPTVRAAQARRAAVR